MLSSVLISPLRETKNEKQTNLTQLSDFQQQRLLITLLVVTVGHGALQAKHQRVHRAPPGLRSLLPLSTVSWAAFKDSSG